MSVRARLRCAARRPLRNATAIVRRCLRVALKCALLGVGRCLRGGLKPALLVFAMPAIAVPVDVETHRIDLAGTVQDVDVYRPRDVVPAGVAIVAHGFTRTRARHRDLGLALAAAGVVAVVPDLPNVVDLWGNGDAIARFVQRLEAGDLPVPAVDRARVVLIGTSAGGLATVLAAAQLPGIAGWIGLDPVDRTGTGSAAAARVEAPAVVLLAEPSLCNLVESGRAIADALPRRLRTVEVANASHCDFEDPTNNFCRAVCGFSEPGARERIRAEIVTTARELLDRAGAEGVQ